MNRKTSFFKALISKDARQQRQQEIQAETEEKERQRKKRAKIEASFLCALIALFGASMSMIEDLMPLGILLLISAFVAWSPLHNLSMKYGPLLKATPSRRRGRKAEKIFHGPRGGKYRMSADGKRRNYF